MEESCRESFRELGFMTLPCLYIFEVITYCRSRCTLIRGRDVHQYETRGRDNYRTQHHRLALSQHLPQEVGVKLINRLPESTIAGSHLSGYLADTLGRRYVLMRGLSLNVLFYILGTFAPNYWSFFIVKVASGILCCPAVIATFPLLGEFVPSKRRAQALLISTSLSSIGILYSASKVKDVLTKPLPTENYNKVSSGSAHPRTKRLGTRGDWGRITYKVPETSRCSRLFGCPWRYYKSIMVV
ncbi:hypothetical protein J6590_082668 [Homalodisca vitripennis]|nr:hypothetical protein J6590_082668 [Homalodisca vitripennis]